MEQTKYIKSHLIQVTFHYNSKHGEGALHIAAGYGRLEVVKELHRAGARLDATDKVCLLLTHPLHISNYI